MKAASFLRTLVLLVMTVLGIGMPMGAYIVTTGVSARTEPSKIESLTARAIRGLAIRTRVRDLTNPVPATDAVHRRRPSHFADHCAVCHANDGSGNTEMGRGLYPRAPDMRLPATQDLSDAELFYIIENGVPLTAMPGWSTRRAPPSSRLTFGEQRNLANTKSRNCGASSQCDHFFNLCSPRTLSVIEIREFFRNWRARRDSNSGPPA